MGLGAVKVNLKKIERPSLAELGWLAGIIDGEGCIQIPIHRRKHEPSFSGNIRVDMCCKKTIDTMANILRRLKIKHWLEQGVTALPTANPKDKKQTIRTLQQLQRNIGTKKRSSKKTTSPTIHNTKQAIRKKNGRGDTTQR